LLSYLYNRGIFNLNLDILGFCGKEEKQE